MTFLTIRTAKLLTINPDVSAQDWKYRGEPDDVLGRLAEREGGVAGEEVTAEHESQDVETGQNSVPLLTVT